MPSVYRYANVFYCFHKERIDNPRFIVGILARG